MDSKTLAPILREKITHKYGSVSQYIQTTKHTSSAVWKALGGSGSIPYWMLKEFGFKKIKVVSYEPVEFTKTETK